MDQKGISPLVIVVVVVAAVIAGVGTYAVYRRVGTGGGDNNVAGNGVVGAASLDFTVNSVYNLAIMSGSTRMRARNIGTGNMDLRVDERNSPHPQMSRNTSIILSGSQHKMWKIDDNDENYNNDNWIDVSNYFENEWSVYSQALQEYKTYLESWNGSGNYTYEHSEWDHLLFYGIVVNPTLDNEVFTPTIVPNYDEVFTPTIVPNYENLENFVVYRISNASVGLMSDTITIKIDGTIIGEHIPPLWMGGEENKITKAEKLAENEFQEFRNLVIGANVFDLENQYQYPEIVDDNIVVTHPGAPTYDIKFTIDGKTKDIFWQTTENLPENLLTIIQKVVEFRDRL